jgi:hypothetical protein
MTNLMETPFLALAIRLKSNEMVTECDNDSEAPQYSLTAVVMSPAVRVTWIITSVSMWITTEHLSVGRFFDRSAWYSGNAF